MGGPRPPRGVAVGYPAPAEKDSDWMLPACAASNQMLREGRHDVGNP
jgi:hypothetical protein